MISDYIKKVFYCESNFSERHENAELQITGFKSKEVLKWVT